MQQYEFGQKYDRKSQFISKIVWIESKMVRIWSKMSKIKSFLTIFDQNWLFGLNNRHLDGLYSFNWKLIEIDQKGSILIKKSSKSIDYNQIMIKFGIVDSNLSLGFESDRNWRLTLDSRYNSMMTIRFVTPNRISLTYGRVTAMNVPGQEIRW